MTGIAGFSRTGRQAPRAEQVEERVHDEPAQAERPVPAVAPRLRRPANAFLTTAQGAGKLDQQALHAL